MARATSCPSIPGSSDIAKNHVRPVRPNLFQALVAGVGNRCRVIEEVQYLAKTIGGVAIVFNDENAPGLGGLLGERARLGEL